MTTFLIILRYFIQYLCILFVCLILSQSILVYLSLSGCTSVNLGLSQSILGYLGLSWALGFFQLSQAMTGHRGVSQATSGNLQLFWAISGFIGLSLNSAITPSNLGYLWLCLGSSGYLWLSQEKTSYCYLKLFHPFFIY